jgi:AcrR family transcriptional regulator
VKLFARHGYERTTIRQIAAEAGISEGTIYVYFGSKEDLLFAILDVSALQPLATLLTDLAAADDEQVIRSFLEDRLSVWERHPSLMKVVFAEALHNRRLAERLCRNVIQPVTDLVSEFISRRVRGGAFRDVNAGIVARVLIGIVFASGLIWGALPCREATPMSRQALVDGFASLVLDGIRNREGRTS